MIKTIPLLLSKRRAIISWREENQRSFENYFCRIEGNVTFRVSNHNETNLIKKTFKEGGAKFHGLSDPYVCLKAKIG